MERARLASFALSGVYIGIILVQPLTGAITKFLNWKASFYIIGACLLIWDRFKSFKSEFWVYLFFSLEITVGTKNVTLPRFRCGFYMSVMIQKIIDSSINQNALCLQNNAQR